MIQSPIKIAIRRKYGTIKAFENAKGLRRHAVRDHLRGYSVSTAEEAITAEFGIHELEHPRLKQRREPNMEADISAAAKLVAGCAVELEAIQKRLEEANQNLARLVRLAPGGLFAGDDALYPG